MCQLTLTVIIIGIVIVEPYTLPFECRDPAPILCLLLCVKVSEAVKWRGENSLKH